MEEEKEEEAPLAFGGVKLEGGKEIVFEETNLGEPEEASNEELEEMEKELDEDEDWEPEKIEEEDDDDNSN